MEDRVYESLVTRYASSWNAPRRLPPGMIAALPPSVPTGKPTNAEFPTSASTPPVNIMTPEPPLGAAPKPPSAAAAPASPAAPRPAAAAAAGTAAGAGRRQEAAAARRSGRPRRRRSSSRRRRGAHS